MYTLSHGSSSLLKFGLKLRFSTGLLAHTNHTLLNEHFCLGGRTFSSCLNLSSYRKRSENTEQHSRSAPDDKPSKIQKRLQDIQRMKNWKEDAQKKSSDRKSMEMKNLLSTQLMRQSLATNDDNATVSNSIQLRVDKARVGRRKHGEREKLVEDNSFYPKLFRSKNVQKIDLNKMNHSLPKIAFAGRSNVGKSSLINALVTKKGSGGKALVSNKPGETQTISCYQLGEALNFIDFPGYGFAFADEERREHWKEEIHNFILDAVKLRRIFILIDVRHGFKESDYSFLTFLNQNKIRNQIILTKCDLLYAEEVAKQYEFLRNQLKIRPFNYTCEDMIVVSSKKMNGIKELQQVIMSFLPEKGLAFRDDVKKKITLPEVPSIVPPKKLTLRPTATKQTNGVAKTSSKTKTRFVGKTLTKPNKTTTPGKNAAKPSSSSHRNRNQ